MNYKIKATGSNVTIGSYTFTSYAKSVFSIPIFNETYFGEIYDAIADDSIVFVKNGVDIPTTEENIQLVSYVIQLFLSGFGRVNDDGKLIKDYVKSKISPFNKVSVDVADSPYTIEDWDTVIEVHNDTGDIELILPEMTEDDIGAEIKLWIEHNPANHKVLIKAPSTGEEINHVSADGSDVAKAEINSNDNNFKRVTIQALGEDECYIDGADSVYNTLRYVFNFEAISDYSPYSYLELSAIPTNFLTSNDSWWFAVKVEKPMTNDSDGQGLFYSNNFGTSIRGNGTYLMTSGTSSYLQNISPNTIIEEGEWIVYQYDHTNTHYTAWINGVKVLDATSSGATPPSTAPTSMWFGSEEGTTSPPSGYAYPLQDCKISNISIGSGNLTDSDAALFTASTFTTDGLSLTGGTLTNQWIPSISDVSTTVTGSINFTLTGDNLTTEEI